MLYEVITEHPDHDRPLRDRPDDLGGPFGRDVADRAGEEVDPHGIRAGRAGDLRILRRRDPADLDPERSPRAADVV